jgi:hypothetical protein
MKGCYLVGNYLGTKAKAAIWFDNHAEARIIAPLLEHNNLLTEPEIKNETDIPVTQYLLHMLDKATK